MLRTTLAAGVMTTLGALPVFLLSAQSVLVRQDLGLSEPQLGLAVSAFFAAGALTATTAGAVAERFGRRTSTVAAGCLTFSSALGIAVVAQSYLPLLILLAVGGMANAALQMTANVSVAQSVPRGRQGLAFGIKQSAVQVSILLAGLAVPTVGVLAGWRWSYVGMAVAGILIMLAGTRLPGQRGGTTRRATAVDRPPRGALVVSFVAMAFASAAVNALGAFLPAWAYRVGLSPGDAGLLVAGASALSVLARVVFGAAADRRQGRNLPVVAAQLVAGAAGLLLLSLAEVPFVIVGALLAFGIGWAWPGLLLFAVVRIGRDSPAAASGAIQAGAFTGGATGPVSFGLLVSVTGYPTAWTAATAAMLTAAALLLVARRMFLADLVRRPPRRPLDAPTEPAD
ncbi:MAG TPA: MFS transporter [Nocardioidaceae bacterium]|nr:MFS transporter [Nocardioidaceae bacterium]